MKKLIVLLGLLAVLFVACAGCISPDVPAVNNTTTTDPIVGTWQSTQSYTVDGKEVYLLYEIKDDNTGYAMMAEAGSTEAKKLDIFWGNDNGKYVFAYTTDTSKVYPHTLSADGKILTDQYGDTYTKI
ncbi:hypothetical protein Mlab_1148 [Methanocorpusculum labreanum Z]|uniref:Lipocalin-like domain-containing protein n=1 Tax=Methanocorpusculum labreanum (strain ATCC 43576 / DSM 4855 / Z) TaxID=410358 RepID=A2SSL1_METLZ|nr:hypothetical protein [Methanocorpusculum labreanum]ABN07317.1 hypothetical protein Mlab_1148 [Methanocorpusculum labreanum Z]